MADGRDPGPGTPRDRYLWTEIFRSFQIAIDPRKLLVAAAGILTMAAGWWVLSYFFHHKTPDRNAAEYQPTTLAKELENRKRPGTNESYTEADLKAEGDRRYAVDRAEWEVLDQLAGENGRLRTAPWYEYRGPNPYLFATDVLAGSSADRAVAVREFFSGSLPVLIEPLVKLLLPIAKLVSPGVSTWTRFYLLLVIVWFLAVWAFFGGIITRLAAIQLANKGPITLRQAFRFVWTRYVNYVAAPLIPLAIIAAIVVGLIVYGVVGMIPFVGDIVLYGLGLPLLLAAGAVMAVFLIGLVGYPLMYTTLSVEGDSSDTFDALSRSINYVYQAPWNYLWYALVAIVYGAAVTFFVVFFTSLMVYLGKWAVSQAPWNEAANRKPDYLFVYAPESFGWRELLLKDSPYAVSRVVAEKKSDIPRDPQGPGDAAVYQRVVNYAPANPTLYAQNRDAFWWYNTVGAGMVGFWVTLAFLMMLGFTYSFFWSASTVIYLLMRRKVDEAELDEVFVEEDEPEAPLAPPKVADGPAPAGPGTSLPVIQAPPTAAPVAAPAPVVASPPVVALPPPADAGVRDVTPPPGGSATVAPASPPTTLPFTPMAAPEPGVPTTPAVEPRNDGDEKPPVM